jgi:hypothetical protein
MSEYDLIVIGGGEPGLLEVDGARQRLNSLQT